MLLKKFLINIGLISTCFTPFLVTSITKPGKIEEKYKTFNNIVTLNKYPWDLKDSLKNLYGFAQDEISITSTNSLLTYTKTKATYTKTITTIINFEKYVMRIYKKPVKNSQKIIRFVKNFKIETPKTITNFIKYYINTNRSDKEKGLVNKANLDKYLNKPFTGDIINTFLQTNTLKNWLKTTENYHQNTLDTIKIKEINIEKNYNKINNLTKIKGSIEFSLDEPGLKSNKMDIPFEYLNVFYGDKTHYDAINIYKTSLTKIPINNTIMNGVLMKSKYLPMNSRSLTIISNYFRLGRATNTHYKVLFNKHNVGVAGLLKRMMPYYIKAAKKIKGDYVWFKIDRNGLWNTPASAVNSSVDLYLGVDSDNKMKSSDVFVSTVQSFEYYAWLILSSVLKIYIKKDQLYILNDISENTTHFYTYDNEQVGLSLKTRHRPNVVHTFKIKETGGNMGTREDGVKLRKIFNFKQSFGFYEHYNNVRIQYIKLNKTTDRFIIDYERQINKFDFVHDTIVKDINLLSHRV